MSDSFLIFSGTTLAEGTLGRFLNITRGVLMRIKVRGRLQGVENVQLGHGTLRKETNIFHQIIWLQTRGSWAVHKRIPKIDSD